MSLLRVGVQQLHVIIINIDYIRVYDSVLERRLLTDALQSEFNTTPIYDLASQNVGRSSLNSVVPGHRAETFYISPIDLP